MCYFSDLWNVVLFSNVMTMWKFDIRWKHTCVQTWKQRKLESKAYKHTKVIWFLQTRCTFSVRTDARTLRKKCPYSKLFWSVFPHIRTGYRKIRIFEVNKMTVLDLKLLLFSFLFFFYFLDIIWKIAINVHSRRKLVKQG